MKEVNLFCLRKKNMYKILWISLVSGWGLIEFARLSYLTKQLPYLYKYEVSLVKTKVLGFYKHYYHYLKLVGMGFKISYTKSAIVFRLGFSHRVLYTNILNLKITYLNKQSFLLSSRNLNIMKWVISKLQKIKKNNAYKKKGLYIKGSIVKIKESTKKGKF